MDARRQINDTMYNGFRRNFMEKMIDDWARSNNLSVYGVIMTATPILGTRIKELYENLGNGEIL